jgi:predicted adenine nucleotide alpha hydrolase (AANH) superfamily ATPase
MNILMHICCSNCAVYPVQKLSDRGVRVKGLWFNPNIHPYAEYRNRFEALRKLAGLWKLEIEYDESYGLVDFLRNVVNNEEQRCRYCYAVRLERTAARAKELKADAFTTSLLVSPYQNFDLIKETGSRMQEKYGVEFYFEDFREGFGEGRRISRELGLYSQKYCGCVYSEMERYMEKKSGGYKRASAEAGISGSTEERGI